MINTNIKLLAKNIFFEKNIEKFFLNKIDKLLYQITGFIKSLIKIKANIYVFNFNVNFIF